MSEPMDNMRSLRVATALGSLLFSLLLFEGALQLVDVPAQVYSGWRNQEMTPLPPTQLNSLECRGRDFDARDPRFAIVLVGDSQTMGLGVEPDAAPEARLRAHLRARGVDWAEVYTLAISGVGQDVQLLLLEELLEDYGLRADLVLLWETPYNDLWNNILPNQWPQWSGPKPTFWLEEGVLRGPSVARVGDPILSPFKFAALFQKALDGPARRQLSDLAWEAAYLPPAYTPVQPTGEIETLFQERYDAGSAWWKWENFKNEKTNFAIGLEPPSPRMEYALRLGNGLLHAMEGLVAVHGGRFLAFDSPTLSSRLWGQAFHFEPRVYAFGGAHYRFSFRQEDENIARLNEGVSFTRIPCDLEDWRMSEEDWHLNARAIDRVMERLAELLLEQGYLPAALDG